MDLCTPIKESGNRHLRDFRRTFLLLERFISHNFLEEKSVANFFFCEVFAEKAYEVEDIFRKLDKRLIRCKLS